MQNIAQFASERLIAPGDSLTSWRVSEAVEVHLPGTARPMPDAVDYRFVNGWVATGDLPCREALRAVLPDRKIELDERPALPNTYPGGESPRVDFSTFRFRPTLVSRWAAATVRMAAPCRLRFELETCGGVHLWAGTEKVAIFEPYERNVPHTTEVALDLPSGETELTVYFDELHERDASCFFRLTLLEGEGLSVEAPGGSEAAEAAAALDALRPDRLFYESGVIRLLTTHPLTRPLEVRLGSSDAGPVTMNVFADPAQGQGEARLTRAGEAVDFLPVDALTPGSVGLTVKAEAGGVRLERHIGITYLPEPQLLDAPTLAARKATARALMCEGGQATPARALVLLESGRPEEAEPLLESGLQAVEERHDCADFFLLPLLRIWRDQRERLTAATRDRLESAILGFRYWLDEPGDDVMWFWSENHVLCFHVAEYVAGTLFPDAVFPNAGMTGAQHREKAHARLLRWFDSIDDHGLAEWNSAAYYPIDYLGVLTLFDMAPDTEIRERARALTDRIFAMVALHTMGGVPGGSQGRAYEKELFVGPATELGTVAAIAFGGPWHRGHDRAAALFAMSDYTPPEGLERLVTVPEGQYLTAAYVQGLDANARLKLWKCAEAQLSSVADHRPGDAGHQQHVVDLQLAAAPLARVWINHPGDLKVWGGSRPSYWAGSGVVPRVAQEGDTALLIFDLDVQAHPIGFTHAFVPEAIMDEVLADGRWVFARAGDGYAALWASAEMERLETGLFAGSEWRAHGRQAGWLIRAGSMVTHGSFADFRAACRALSPSFDPEGRVLRAGALGLSFDGPLTVDGLPQHFAPMSTRPHVGWNGDAPAPLTLRTEAHR